MFSVVYPCKKKKKKVSCQSSSFLLHSLSQRKRCVIYKGVEFRRTKSECLWASDHSAFLWQLGRLFKRVCDWSICLSITKMTSLIGQNSSCQAHVPILFLDSGREKSVFILLKVFLKDYPKWEPEMTNMTTYLKVVSSSATLTVTIIGQSVKVGSRHVLRKCHSPIKAFANAKVSSTSSEISKRTTSISGGFFRSLLLSICKMLWMLHIRCFYPNEQPSRLGEAKC